MMLWENRQGLTHLLMYIQGGVMAPTFNTLNFVMEFVVLHKSKEGFLTFLLSQICTVKMCYTQLMCRSIK